MVAPGSSACSRVCADGERVTFITNSFGLDGYKIDLTQLRFAHLPFLLGAKGAQAFAQGGVFIG